MSNTKSDQTDGSFAVARRAILLCDMPNSVGRTAEDERGFTETLISLTRLVATSIVPAHGGRFIKSTGDGFLAVFERVVDAVDAVSNFKTQWTARQAEETDFHPAYSIGFADVRISEFDVYGSEVNIAARLVAMAGAGEVLLTTAARDALVLESPFQCDDLGFHDLRNMSERVRVYRLAGQRFMPEAMRLASLKPTIAILPFRLATPSADNISLGDIVAEELIRLTSGTELFNVISRLSTSRYRHRPGTSTEIGHDLGAHYLVMGTVTGRETDGRFHITVECRRAANNQVRFASEAECTMADIIHPDSGVLADIARNILKNALTTELEISSVPVLGDGPLYSRMIAAISMMHRLSPDDFRKAGEWLKQVIEKSPRHAEPRAWLAKWHTLELQQGYAGAHKATEEAALSQVNRALDLEPENSMALAMSGLVHTNLMARFDEAEDLFRRSVRSNPNNAQAWLHRAIMKTFSRQYEDGVSDAKRAVTLSPVDPHGYYVTNIAATCAIGAGMFDLANEIADMSLRDNAMHTSSWRGKIIAAWHAGKHEEARAAARRLLDIEPDFNIADWRKRSPGAKAGIGELAEEAYIGSGIPHTN